MDHAALQTAIAGALNRGDLYGAIPAFIALGEAQIARDLRHWRMTARATASLSDEVEALPDDFLELISVGLEAPARVLDNVAPDALAERKAREGARTGRPDSFALIGGALQLYPAPDGPCGVTISYYRQVAPLSAAAPTNWLLEAFPDLYLYGALTHAAAHLAPDGRAAVWKQLFDEAMAAARADGVRALAAARPTPRAWNVV